MQIKKFWYREIIHTLKKKEKQEHIKTNEQMQL